MSMDDRLAGTYGIDATKAPLILQSSPLPKEIEFECMLFGDPEAEHTIVGRNAALGIYFSIERKSPKEPWKQEWAARKLPGTFSTLKELRNAWTPKEN